MKLEIEITEEEIKSAIERKIRVAVADQTNSWTSEGHIKDRVKALWVKCVDEAIIEALANSEALKKKIADELERKLRSQLNAAMKKAV